MANAKDFIKGETSSSVESQEEECEPFWLVKGPPFDQRDYMISPSESSSAASTIIEKVPEKKKLKPEDIKIDEKYLLDSKGALNRLLGLIKDGYAHQFVDRLEELIKIFLRDSPLGFVVGDLPLIIEIVEYFSRNMSSVPQYKIFVLNIMCYAREPPKIEKTSDALHCKDTLADYFTLFGELLASFEDECFQMLLLEALDALLLRRELVDISCVKLSLCYEALEESHLPSTIALLMETVPMKLYFHYLEAALKIVLVSEKAGYKMIQANLLDYVLQRLEPNDPEMFPKEVLEKESELHEYNWLIDRSSYVVWGLFGIISKHGVDVPVPGENALWSLKFVIQREGRKKIQRAIEVRNNLAGILVKLVSIFRDKLCLVSTGLMTDIAMLAVATEIKAKTDWIAQMNCGVKKEDYLLKQFMLLCCCLLAKSKDSVEVFISCQVVEGLLKLLNPKTTAPWNPSQFVNLLTVTLRILSEIVPQCPEVYIQERGNARLLHTIKWLVREDCEQDILLEALKTFATIVSCGNSNILEDAKMQGGISLLLDLGFRLLDVTFMKLKHQEKLSRVFVSLDKLVTNDRKFQTTLGNSYVKLSIKLLQRVLENSENDSKWSPKLMLSFGGFLWEAVAWSRSALISFIELGGVFILLDFIEVNNFPLQMLFMGVLVDMTDEGETVAHLLTWRGKSGCGVVSLMIDIWRKEEYFTKVHRTKDGFIKDLDMPLMTEEQWYLTHQFPEGYLYSPSIAEMMCSARPKIHALYQFLMTRYYDLTQVGESAYQMQINAVKPKQSVYIPLIEHYLALKMGEVWYEVIREAKITGTLPLAFDGETICTLIEEKNNWASRIRTMQEEIALSGQSGYSVKEKKCYAFLKSCTLAGALEALNELEYISSSSFKEYQIRKKEKQIRTVDKSLEPLSVASETNFHRTFLTKSNVVSMRNICVWVKSQKEASVLEAPAPVSPETSGESRFDTDTCEF